TPNDDRGGRRTRDLGPREEWVVEPDRPPDERTVRVEDLSEAVSPHREASIASVDERTDIARALAQVPIDRSVESSAEPDVEKETGGREHRRHHDRERERQANADGYGRDAGHGSPAAVSSQPVARPAHSLDRFQPERTVDLLPQVPDVDVHDVRAVLVSVVPGVLEQVEPREHLPGSAHEDLEQGELLGRKIDLPVAPPCLPGYGVEA